MRKALFVISWLSWIYPAWAQWFADGVIVVDASGTTVTPVVDAVTLNGGIMEDNATLDFSAGVISDLAELSMTALGNINMNDGLIGNGEGATKREIDFSDGSITGAWSFLNAPEIPGYLKTQDLVQAVSDNAWVRRVADSSVSQQIQFGQPDNLKDVYLMRNFAPNGVTGLRLSDDVEPSNPFVEVWAGIALARFDTTGVSMTGPLKVGGDIDVSTHALTNESRGIDFQTGILDGTWSFSSTPTIPKHMYRDDLQVWQGAGYNLDMDQGEILNVSAMSLGGGAAFEGSEGTGVLYGVAWKTADNVRFRSEAGFEGNAAFLTNFPSSVVTTENIPEDIVTTNRLGSVNGRHLIVGQGRLNVSDRVKILGPIELNAGAWVYFENSQYIPGIGSSDPTADFGYYPVQSGGAAINPARIFGTGVVYRIIVVSRVDGLFNDGLHFVLRKTDASGTAAVGGMNDLHINQRFMTFISEQQNTGTDWNYVYYLSSYFAAYDGGNGGTIQDTTVYLIGDP